MKSHFYEQVTGVKGCDLSFPHQGLCFAVLLLVLVASHVALHLVSMRTLMS